MFLTLFVTTFVIAVVVCFLVERVFSKPIKGILDRIISDESSGAATRYVKFASDVVGISGGVQLSSLEDYLIPPGKRETVVELTRNHWILEIYRTLIGSLQSIAWMLLVFFVVALVAYVIVHLFESTKKLTGAGQTPGGTGN